MAAERPVKSIDRGALGKARFYLGKSDTEIDYYSAEVGQIAASTVGDAEKEGPNEDSAAIVPVDGEYLVLMVADGVGGMAGAQRASNLTVSTIRESLAKLTDVTARRLRGAILDGIETANRRVMEQANGSASTLALAEIGPGYVRTYHIGDSVLILCGQRGRIKLQTTPHSPVGFAMEAGLLDEKDALEHAELNLIFNVIGSNDMRIEIGSELPMAPRDTLLLASDGLMDNMMQEEIVNTIRKGCLQAAIRELTTTAQRRMQSLDAGKPSKPDDFTAILFRRHPPRRRPPEQPSIR
jgi:serine/threonine protein phosphatase PrpC